MTTVVEKATDTILTQGVFGALFLLVAIGATWVIRIMYQNAIKQNEQHLKQMKEERDEHTVQMNAILERADVIQAQGRADSRERETVLMEKLSELSTSFAGLSNGFGIFTGILERNTSDIKEVKQEVSSLKDVMLMKKE